MRIDHEAKVRTRDGHAAGHVKQAIWDARGSEINEYVVTTGGLVGHDVIVSKEMLESAARDGSEIVLDISKHDLDQLARYEPTRFTTPPADSVAPPVSGFPTGSHLFPVAESEIADRERTT